MSIAITFLSELVGVEETQRILKNENFPNFYTDWRSKQNAFFGQSLDRVRAQKKISNSIDDKTRAALIMIDACGWEIIKTRPQFLAQAAPHIGHRAIRNLGTFGGALAYADPAAEWPACAVALDATLPAGQPGAGEHRRCRADAVRGRGDRCRVARGHQRDVDVGAAVGDGRHSPGDEVDPLGRDVGGGRCRLFGGRQHLGGLGTRSLGRLRRGLGGWCGVLICGAGPGVSHPCDCALRAMAVRLRSTAMVSRARSTAARSLNRNGKS